MQISVQFEFKVCWFLIFQYEVAVLTKDGAVIEPATSADTNWDIAPLVKYVQTSSFFQITYGICGKGGGGGGGGGGWDGQQTMSCQDDHFSGQTIFDRKRSLSMDLNVFILSPNFHVRLFCWRKYIFAC